VQLVNIASEKRILKFQNFTKKHFLPSWTGPAIVSRGGGQEGFVVDKVALGRVISEYFGFPCQSSFHQILDHHDHPGQV
jgi:hypothetical protein